MEYRIHNHSTIHNCVEPFNIAAKTIQNEIAQSEQLHVGLIGRPIESR